MRTIITRIDIVEYDHNDIVDGGPRKTEIHKENIEDIFLYSELSPTAKEAVRNDAIDSEWRDPCGHYSMACDDVWRAVQGIEKQTPFRFKTGYNEADAFVTMRCASDPDAYTLDDNGECYSIDLCEIWNKHMPEMERISKDFDGFDGDPCDSRAYKEWEKLLGSIGDDMASYIRKTLDAERDYYTSHEFWDEWLDDSDEYFTKDGMRTR